MMTGTPLAFTQTQGRWSTETWGCSMRGETIAAAEPKRGDILTFSVRYCRTTTPRASGAANGRPTMICAVGCAPASGAAPAAGRFAARDRSQDLAAGDCASAAPEALNKAAAANRITLLFSNLA